MSTWDRIGRQFGQPATEPPVVPLVLPIAEAKVQRPGESDHEAYQRFLLGNRLYDQVSATGRPTALPMPASVAPVDSVANALIRLEALLEARHRGDD